MIQLTNITQLTMSSQFETITTDKGSVELYLKDLMTTPVNSKDAYVDFTEICSLYGKEAFNFLKLSSTKEYIDIITEEYDITNKVTKTITGRSGKTFLHYDLLFQAMRWLDTRLAVQMDNALKQVFRQADIVKVDREQTIKQFHPLDNAIALQLVPKLNSDHAKRFIYSTVFDFANKVTIGMTSKQFKDENQLDKNSHIRQYFTEVELNQVIKVEQQFHMYITQMGFTSFHQIKAFHLKRVDLIHALTLTVDELKTLNQQIDKVESRKPTDKNLELIESLKRFTVIPEPHNSNLSNLI